MKDKKKLFNTKAKRIWAGVTIPVLVVLLIANIVAQCYLPGFMDMMFGGSRTEVSGSSENQFELSEGVTDKASALKAANELNLKINEEGIILLKNENCLPLQRGARVSVFGKNASNLAYGSSGSAKSPATT